MGFEEAFNEVIMAEGGYVDHPLDKGGKTKYGISQRWYPHEDIKNLTMARAKEIYRRDYWDKLLLDRIISDQIASEVFDTAINMGPRSATWCVQNAINFLKPGTLRVDKQMGLRTISAVNAWIGVNEETLFKCLNGFQFIRYVHIIEERPDQAVFSAGWMKRIQRYRG